MKSEQKHMAMYLFGYEPLSCRMKEFVQLCTNARKNANSNLVTCDMMLFCYCHHNNCCQ